MSPPFDLKKAVYVADHGDLIHTIEKQRAALKILGKRGKALIEERANCVMAYEWEESLPELDETAEEERYRKEAREQLRREGLL